MKLSVMYSIWGTNFIPHNGLMCLYSFDQNLGVLGHFIKTVSLAISNH